MAFGRTARWVTARPHLRRIQPEGPASWRWPNIEGGMKAGGGARPVV